MIKSNDSTSKYKTKLCRNWCVDTVLVDPVPLGTQNNSECKTDLTLLSLAIMWLERECLRSWHWAQRIQLYCPTHRAKSDAKKTRTPT